MLKEMYIALPFQFAFFPLAFNITTTIIVSLLTPNEKKMTFDGFPYEIS